MAVLRSCFASLGWPGAVSRGSLPGLALERTIWVDELVNVCFYVFICVLWLDLAADLLFHGVHSHCLSSLGLLVLTLSYDLRCPVLDLIISCSLAAVGSGSSNFSPDVDLTL